MGKVRFYQPGDEQIYITPVRPLYTEHLVKPGDYYPASDYEALESDRDEWKKRCIEEGEETARLFEKTRALEAKLAALTELFADVTRALADDDQQIADLKAKLTALVEAADAVEQKWALVGWGYDPELRGYLKSAIAAAKGTP